MYTLFPNALDPGLTHPKSKIRRSAHVPHPNALHFKNASSRIINAVKIPLNVIFHGQIYIPEEKRARRSVIRSCIRSS